MVTRVEAMMAAVVVEEVVLVEAWVEVASGT